MRRLLRIMFFFAIAVGGPLRAQQTSQQSMIGLLDLAIKERNPYYTDSNVFGANAQNWNATRGGPKLAALGIHLGDLIRRDRPMAFIVNILMIILIRVAILRAMAEGENVPRVIANVLLKLMVGVLFVNFPQYVYAIGMVTRDAGVYLMRNAYELTSSSTTPAGNTVTGSPTNLDFELIRVAAIRRALRDHSQPMIGNASGVTYDLYDQLARLTNATVFNQIQPVPISGQATQLEKTRMLTDRMPILLEALSRMPRQNGTINWVAKRIGRNGIVEYAVYGVGGTADLTTAGGTEGFATGTFASSRVSVTSPSLVQWLNVAELIRADFQQKADNGDFATIEEMNAAEESAKQQYDSMIYTRTSAFIRQTLWTEVAFASGRMGGAANTWQYPNSWSQDDQTALNYWIDKVGGWYDSSTGRAGASFNSSQPQDEKEFGWSHTIVRMLGKVRDAVIARWGFWFFDIVIEAYVFALCIAFPLWFYQTTAKAFTGALNTFIVACITPATLTLIYLIWDAFMTKVLHLITGGVFDLGYEWLKNVV